VEQAAAGMYRVACTNMAEGVREVTVKRGQDPRELPLIVAGGAGPLHSCLIASELDIGLQIVPRESSVLCAAGMLVCDLRHDFVHTMVGRFPDIDWAGLDQLIGELCAEGESLLAAENVAHVIRLDCRYLKQYHEVSFVVPADVLASRDGPAILTAFHAEHNRLYGYSLETERTPVEIINVRVESVGKTEPLRAPSVERAGADASAALKARRRAWVLETDTFSELPVYDGARLRYGNHIDGPALIESETTTTYVSAAYAVVTDQQGALVLHPKNRPDLAASPQATPTRA
jgi:N-methylhydantoinase A